LGKFDEDVVLVMAQSRLGGIIPQAIDRAADSSKSANPLRVPLVGIFTPSILIHQMKCGQALCHGNHLFIFMCKNHVDCLMELPDLGHNYLRNNQN